MFIPVEYAWAEPVAIAAMVIFVIAWIANSIVFGNTFLDALATAVVFGLILTALAYVRVATIPVRTMPTE